MDLKSLQRQWTEFGEEDPLWSNLSDPAMRHGRWSLEAFFATGAKEIGELVTYLDAQVPRVPRRRALDFGCGVGRLSQALCDHFETCDGVDISPSMIERARQFNRHGDRCLYHLNTAGNLALFEDERFDVIYSNLVLQHMSPELFERYICEFVRVLHRDGLAVFQLPDRQGSRRAPPNSRVNPLAPDAFRAVLKPSQESLSAEADADLVVPVVVTNAGRSTWPSSGETHGRLKVHLGNHWLDARGRVVVRDDGRASLPHDLQAGESATVNLAIRTPHQPGRYLLELDMVQEGVAWFQEKGSSTVRLAVQVTGTPVKITERLRSLLRPLRRGTDPAPEGASGTRLLMHGARPERVAAWIRDAGGRIVDIRGDGHTGEWPGYLYTVSKSESRTPLDVERVIAARETTMTAARALIVPAVQEVALRAGEAGRITARVRNESQAAWPDARSAEGVSEIRLGNHWLNANGAMVQVDDGRADLVRSVEAGGEIELSLDVRAPQKSGNYILELDMVREHVGWFSEFGSKTARIPVRVS